MKIKLILLGAACLFIVACSQTSLKESSEEHDIEIVVHRGANRLAPENTLPAFKKAIEYGAEFIEVDVFMSQDSTLYCFHDATFDRTTNGTGDFASQTSAYIDTLDAGSWFGNAFANTRVPRLNDIVSMVSGKAKFYFDVKHADLNLLADFIYTHDLKESCFVWFSDRKYAREFKKLAPDIPLKMNASSAKEVEELIEIYNPEIIECNVYNISPELQEFCKSKGIKVMANLFCDSWWEYKQAIETGVDMVNIDHPDYFISIKNDSILSFNQYRLAAHRGGITEGLYDEYDPASIQAALDSGYWMLEIDLRPTADKKIIVHHDHDLERIYGVDKNVTDMTLEELKNLNAVKGGYAPLTFEELAALCRGKAKFMVDIKPKEPEEWFVREIKAVLEKYNMMDDAHFIRNDLHEYFGKGKYGFRMHEALAMKKRLEAGEDIAAQYYLFDHGNVINAQVARWCQKNYIDVCASVNIGHYPMEHHKAGALRDIEYLKKCGVTMFQIDSPYDEAFNLDAIRQINKTHASAR